MARRSRRWCVTVHAIANCFADARIIRTEDDMGLITEPTMVDDFNMPEYVTFFVGQLERGTATSATHVQAYVEVSTEVTLEEMKQKLSPLFGLVLSTRAHLEIARGTREQNEEYCTKEETRIPGTSPLRFQRQNSQEVVGRDDIKKKAKELRRLGIEMCYDLSIEYEGNIYMAIHHVRGKLAETEKFTAEYEVLFHCLTQLSSNRCVEGYGKFVASKRKREVTGTQGVTVRAIQVVVLLGPPGTGKTREIFERYTSSLYKAVPYSRFQCAYDPDVHRVILLDDYVGETTKKGKDAFFTVSMLQALCEGYPVFWDVKNKPAVELNHVVLAITTNLHPSRWFDDYLDIPHETRTSIMSRIPEACIEKFEGADKRLLSAKPNYANLFVRKSTVLVRPTSL